MKVRQMNEKKSDKTLKSDRTKMSDKFETMIVRQNEWHEGRLTNQKCPTVREINYAMSDKINNEK